MIVTKTPLRVSFVGGGTDFSDYYRIKEGRVISTAIDKHIYVTIAKKFDNKIHLRYSDFECVDNIEQLKHNLVREALKLAGITKGVEIVTISDIPTTGSGLGSSSSLAVGLLKVLYAYKGFNIDTASLAKQACELEIEILQSPIGKQDQYAASFGGLNLITFKSNESVKIDNLLITANYEKIKWLQNSSMLFYLGEGRLSTDILLEHKNAIKDKIDTLDKQSQLTKQLYQWLHTDDNGVNRIVGELINLSWKYKVEMTPQATNNTINRIISIVMQSGAYGAKVCGAGGSGFLLVICEREKQHFVRQALNHLTELNFNFENEGAKVIYAD